MGKAQIMRTCPLLFHVGAEGDLKKKPLWDSTCHINVATTSSKPCSVAEGLPKLPGWQLNPTFGQRT